MDAIGRGFVATASQARASAARVVAARVGITAVATASLARATTARVAQPVSRYAGLLRQLLPPGAAWLAPQGSVLAVLLSRLAAELSRVDARVAALLAERDPRTADELLADWEHLLALSPAGSLDDRRAAVVARLTGRGGQHREFYRQLAASFGYDIEIIEHRPFVAGSPAGAALTNGSWIYVWHVRTQSGERDEQLEQTLRAHVPAHTLLRITFEE